MFYYNLQNNNCMWPQYVNAGQKASACNTSVPIQQYQPNMPVYNPNFVGNYWQYQNANYINNNINVSNSFYELSNNMRLAQTFLNNFNAQYPNLESFTMSELLAKKQERVDPYSFNTKILKNRADKNFETMIGCLNSRPDQKDITFEQYIDIIKNEFRNHNMGNCGERAYVLFDNLNKYNIKNHAVIEIGGNKPSNGHVFNVIGLAPNAIYDRPETWGENAVVVDAWANRIMRPQDAFNFYHNFLEYGENNPMKIENLDVTKLFKSPS